MKRTASRIAIAIIVSPAFFDSGGLKAGTPLAIASVPVRATDPLAKAFRRRKIPRPSEPDWTALACWTSTAWPVITRITPSPTIVSARPRKR